MKNFALVVAVALLALAVPASASEISEAAFLTTLAQQIEAPLSPIDLGITPVPIPPSCDNVNSLACPRAGATTVCRDGCGYHVSCVCTTYVGTLKYWNCGWQC
jgi:hypothetical protein